MCTETILIDKNITIRSNAKSCTIVFQKGQLRFVQSSAPKLSYIKFVDAENTAVYCENASPEFEACTFTNNKGLNGGAVYCKNGEPAFRQCYFAENEAQNGGALYLDENANATIEECLVYTNTATNGGGGIYINKSKPVFAVVNICFNTADMGGGMYAKESEPAFKICLLDSNNADTDGGGFFISNMTSIITNQFIVNNNSANNGNGGGLYFEHAQSMNLQGDVIDGNTAKDGAGIYITDSDAFVIQQCMIYGNKASNNGGAIYIKNAQSTQLSNLLISENDALDGGGAYYENCATGSEIIFCTFTRNKSISSTETGIVYFDNTSANIVNSILWNIDSDEIESVRQDQYPLSVTYSDVEMDDTTNVYQGNGNINKDPLFENAAEKDKDRYLHLLDLDINDETSPCINSGIKLDDNLPQVDLYNNDRSKHGETVDMGAIEYVVGNVEFTATPDFGRDPLVVELRCHVTPSGNPREYSFLMDFDDGSEKIEGSDGTFNHTYNFGDTFNPQCIIFLKKNPTIYSIPDRITVDVASYLWRFDTGDVIESSPAIGQDGSIYVGSDSGAMFGINPDGSKKWRFQTGGRITSSPSVYSDTVIFGSEDSNVYKVDATNGRKIWSFDTHGEIYSSPAIDKSGNIYIGSCDYNLYAITPDGHRKWSFFTKNRVISSPSIVYYTYYTQPYNHPVTISTIYIGSHDNRLYALDLDTGDLQWSIDVGGKIWGTPSISDDRSIYVVGTEMMGAANPINLFALNPDGSIKWKHEMIRGAYASPILFSSIIKSQSIGMVLIGSYDNNLYGLSYSGYEQWTFPTSVDADNYPADILSSPAVDNSGYIYFGSENHWIYAIDHEKGRIRWSYKTDGPMYSSPVINNKVLYVGSFDHYLYAIRTNEESLSTSSPWPVYHQNAAHHSCLTIDDLTMPPTVLKTYPEPNATGLAANVPITLSVTFSKLMYTGTIDISFEEAIDSETLASEKIQYTTETINNREVTVATFQPISSTLEPDTRYKIRIASTAVDQNNNRLQGDWVWVFHSEETDSNADPSGMRGCFIDTLVGRVAPKDSDGLNVPTLERGNQMFFIISGY
jgi:parallel beta-helix repeat protein